MFWIFAGASCDPTFSDKWLKGGDVIRTTHPFTGNLLKFVRHFQKHLTEPEINRFLYAIDLLGKACMLECKSRTFQNKDADPSLIASIAQIVPMSVSEEIEQLQTFERLVVYGGYSSSTIGHCVLYEIYREEEDRYRFTVFNTGEAATAPLPPDLDIRRFGGLNTDPSQRRAMIELLLEIGISYTDQIKALEELKPGDKAAPVTWLASKEAVCNEQLWKKLFYYNEKCSDAHSMRCIYNDLHRHFVQYESNPEFLPLHPIQSWGSCSFDPLLIWTKSVFPKDLGLAFHLFLVLEADRELQKLLPMAQLSHMLQDSTVELIIHQSVETLQKLKAESKALWSSHPTYGIAQRLSQEGHLKDPEALREGIKNKILRKAALEKEMVQDPNLRPEWETLRDELTICENELEKRLPGESLLNGIQELFSALQDILRKCALHQEILNSFA